MREVLYNLKATFYSIGTIMAAIALVFYINGNAWAATDGTDPVTTDPGTGTTTTPVTTDPTTTDPTTTTTPTDTTTTTPTTTDTTTPVTTTDSTPISTTATTTTAPAATTSSPTVSKTTTKTTTKTTPVTTTTPVAATDTTQTAAPTAETIPTTKSSVVSKASATTTVAKAASFNPLPIIASVVGFVILAGALLAAYLLKFRRKRSARVVEPAATESVFEQALETAPPELVPVPISTETTRVAQPHAPALHVPAQINPYRMLVQ